MNLAAFAQRLGSTRLILIYIAFTLIFPLCIQHYGQCWMGQGGPDGNRALHDRCLSLWDFAWQGVVLWFAVTLLAALGINTRKFPQWRNARLIIASASAGGLLFCAFVHIMLIHAGAF